MTHYGIHHVTAIAGAARRISASTQARSGFDS
jgi:hypothetical protein